MSSELDILKNIWENKGKSYVKLISHQTGLGLDYVRYICKSLLKKRQIKAERKPNCYRITAQGKKALKLQGIIRPERKSKGIKKVVLPWPKKSLKIKIPKKKLIVAQEKKLRLGKMIEKTISFLRASAFSAKPKHITNSYVLGKGRKRRKSPDGKAVEDPRQSREKKYVKRRKIKSN